MQGIFHDIQLLPFNYYSTITVCLLRRILKYLRMNHPHHSSLAVSHSSESVHETKKDPNIHIHIDLLPSDLNSPGLLFKNKFSNQKNKLLGWVKNMLIPLFRVRSNINSFCKGFSYFTNSI